MRNIEFKREVVSSIKKAKQISEEACHWNKNFVLSAQQCPAYLFFSSSLLVYVEEMKEFWRIFRRLGNEFFSSEILGGSQSEIEGKPLLMRGPQAEGKLLKGRWCRAPRDD